MFGSLWIERLLYQYRDVFLCIGMRLRRIPIHFFGNRMVVVHPSLSNDTSTRSANAFGEDRIAGFLPGE